MSESGWSRRVRVGSIDIAYDDVPASRNGHGTGARPLVLLHGFTGSRDDWSDVLRPLAAYGRTLAPDLRGHGESGRADDARGYAIERLADDVLAVADAAGAARFDLLGHSILGGSVALALALGAPERVASLVLMNTAADRDGIWGEMRIQFDWATQVAHTAGQAALYEIIRSGMERQASPAIARTIARIGADAYWRRGRAKLLAMDAAAFRALFEAIDDHPGFADRLGAIACPTTVIVGAEDARFGKPCESLAASIPGARLVVIPDAEHAPQMENPDAWIAAIAEHLARARGGSA